MGRMIDTDAAYAVLTDYYHHTTDIQHEALREALGRVETVDAVPVVHGRWKRKIVDCGFNADWVCSQCGHRVMTDFVSYKYCPNCGARMDGDHNE